MTAYPDSFRWQVLEGLRAASWSVQIIAAAYGVHHSTVTRWARAARIKLPPAAERRWPGRAQRRARARRLRARGASLAKIRGRLGYSLGGA